MIKKLVGATWIPQSPAEHFLAENARADKLSTAILFRKGPVDFNHKLQPISHLFEVCEN